MSLTPIPANLFSGAALRRVGNGSTLELVSRTAVAVAGTRPSCQGRRIQCSTRRALQPNGAGRGQIWCQQLLLRCSPLDVSQRPPRRANRGRPRSWPRGTRSESRGVPITPCPWRLNHSIRFFISASFRFVTLWFRRGFGRSSVQNRSGNSQRVPPKYQKRSAISTYRPPRSLLAWLGFWWTHVSSRRRGPRSGWNA